ncbi:MAG: PglZ domain-containing protein, partial [bacterium]|nr:PglZ domain-containing protein [bacterium]
LNDQNAAQTEELLANPKIRTAGLIVDKIDKIMHGMELGAAGMHNQILQWAKQGFLATLINRLLDHRFSIYLTSDHGNIEAGGCGRPTEGAAVDRRGERVRIYHDQLLRKKTNLQFPDALPWPPTGLPENYYPLLAPNRSAFVNQNQRTVCHGGISIEEVIVPLVKIGRREP